ncbi:cytochrome c oxidase subunit II [Parasphingorhabdus flavimaris]|jgi:cytochrome c oxidase subunit 2|uniref:Cytochrome c oxidase subunit 2 n=1 Tax=Parasphingorhabdus flavimaris TaxID=266812 RepID=A0ABX2N433_9SPHN|nr:cytochrome c oxidase subunit II [Parasphingorhabdus flavimaris]NVD28447.1 cytochrome c oxidase subunit II [Parasphingorhabdus flavimaris]|tara:strand:+ start:1574 stop:2599 length:1026 start_codon:yes stop_codon:yes gene_type:complete
MTHFVKAWILAIGLILTPTALSAQEALPAAPVVDPVASSELEAAEVPAEAAATASGLDPALYTPMKPTEGIGMPVDGGIDFQEQFSETGKTAHWINNAILVPMMVGVSLLVLFLLIWVVFRFRRGANAVPSKTTHNTFIEIIWTVIPVLILVVIAVPSISLLAEQFEPAPEDALTVKVTGYQWYWGYGYPDNGDFEVISNMLTEEEADARGEPYQLAADNRMVIPVGKPVKLLITAADVIHSFAIPAAWFKLDAVPGRINEKVLQIDREGVYYGQCSELCGARHGFMPITVEVLSEEKFNNWVRANGGTVKGEAAEAAPTDADASEATTEIASADAAAATN